MPPLLQGHFGPLGTKKQVGVAGVEHLCVVKAVAYVAEVSGSSSIYFSKPLIFPLSLSFFSFLFLVPLFSGLSALAAASERW